MVIFKGKTVQKSSRFPKFSGPDIKKPPLVHDQNGPKGGGFLKGMGLILIKPTRWLILIKPNSFLRARIRIRFNSKKEEIAGFVTCLMLFDTRKWDELL